MSKIFKISGNLMIGERLFSPCYSFEGEMVLADDEKTFCGFCNNSGAEGASSISSIAGLYSICKNTGKKSLSFYKSPSTPGEAAIFCTIPNPNTSAYGTWGTYVNGKYQYAGKAKVIIEEVEYTAKSEFLIKNNYNRIINSNPIVAIS